MDSKQLLWAIGFIHLKRKKRKKSSDDAATDGDLGASVLRGDVAWPDNVENDGQRETAVDYLRPLRKARKAKKTSDDAVTDVDAGASVL